MREHSCEFIAVIQTIVNVLDPFPPQDLFPAASFQTANVFVVAQSAALALVDGVALGPFAVRHPRRFFDCRF